MNTKLIPFLALLALAGEPKVTIPSDPALDAKQPSLMPDNYRGYPITLTPTVPRTLKYLFILRQSESVAYVQMDNPEYKDFEMKHPNGWNIYLQHINDPNHPYTNVTYTIGFLDGTNEVELLEVTKAKL